MSGSAPVEGLVQVVCSAVEVVLSLDAASVTEPSRLGDLGADSLALVGIADVVEEALRDRGLSLHIDDASLRGMVTVGDIVAYAASASTSAASPVGMA